jgi:hypothetical protein
LVWHADGSISFRANNGKFVACKKSGHLFANTDNVEESAKYYFYLINRPGIFINCFVIVLSFY